MGKSSSGIIRGYTYHVREEHLASISVEKLLRIRLAKKVVWEDEIDENTEIIINRPDLYGGDTAEGGAVGAIRVRFGDPGQTPIQELIDLFGIEKADRGLLTFFYPNFIYGQNNHYRPGKAADYLVSSIGVLEDRSPEWYPEKAEVAQDLNIAHAFRRVLTEPYFGSRYHVSKIDDANFRAAADTFFSEGLGVGFLFKDPNNTDQFLELLETHGMCKYRENPTTGLLELKLLRNDYVVANLPVIGPSEYIEVTEMQGNTWDGTANELIVTYYDIEADQEIPLTLHDLGNITIHGRIVSKRMKLLGYHNGTAAAIIGEMHLRAQSTPLVSGEILCNRKVFGLNVGDAFVLNTPDYPITSAVCRVGRIDLGSLKKGSIRINFTQDVFSITSGTYIVPAVREFPPGLSAPIAPIARTVYEVPYWTLATQLSAANFAQIDPDFCFVAGAAVRGNAGQLSARLWDRVGSADYTEAAAGAFAPSFLIDDALVPEVQSTVDFSSGVDLGITASVIDMSAFVVGHFAIIDSELVQIVGIDNDLGEVVLARGVLDTVPIAHLAGTRCYIAEFRSVFDRTSRAGGTTVDCKILSWTFSGYTDLGTTPVDSITLNNRQKRPYPPGNLQIDGNRYPAGTTGDIDFTWAHRDRITQTAFLVAQDAGDIGPEAGTTYTLRIYNDTTSTLVRTETGITGTTYTYTQAQRIIDFAGAGPHAVRIELESVRDAIVSWQAHDWTFTASDL